MDDVKESLQTPEPEEGQGPIRKNTRGRGILRILLCTGLLLGLMIAFGIMGLLLDDALRLNQTDLMIDVFGNVGIGVSAWITCVILRKATGERLRDVIHLKGFCFGLVIALTLASWSIGEVFDHVMGLCLSGFMVITPDETDMTGISSLISAVVCAPIFEELIFRFGFMGFLKKNSGKAFTILFTTLIFSLIHTYNLQNTGNVFVGTLFAAYVYYRTGNILYTMCEHALHNAICFLPFGEWTLLGANVYYEKNGFILCGLPWFFINLVIMILSLAWLIKYFTKQEEEK